MTIQNEQSRLGDFVTEANLLFVLDGLEDAHAALLMLREHEGSAHCKCRVAELIRDIYQRYGVTIRRLRRPRGRKRKALQEHR